MSLLLSHSSVCGVIIDNDTSSWTWTARCASFLLRCGFDILWRQSVLPREKQKTKIGSSVEIFMVVVGVHRLSHPLPPFQKSLSLPFILAPKNGLPGPFQFFGDDDSFTMSLFLYWKHTVQHTSTVPRTCTPTGKMYCAPCLHMQDSVCLEPVKFPTTLTVLARTHARRPTRLISFVHSFAFYLQ